MIRLRWLLPMLVVLAVVLLAGCGGGSHHARTAAAPSVHKYVHEPLYPKREASKRQAPPRAGLAHLRRGTGVTATRPIVPSVPLGPSSTGWHVAYADSFAATIGSGAGMDAGWKANANGQGCCNNGDEIDTEITSKIRTSEQAGLEALCSKEATGGHAFACGGADTNTPAGFKWKFGGGQEWAFQSYMKAPPAADCGEDPGWWGSDPAWTDEIDFTELWDWNAACKYSGGIPVWIYKTPSSTIRLQCVPWEGCSTWIPNPEAWHTYTTVVHANNQVQEYIDGHLMGTIGPPSGINTPWDHLIVTHALRERSILSSTSVFAVGYAAVYEIGSGNVEHGGVAPGTCVGNSGCEPSPPPETTPTTTPTPTPPPEPAPSGKPAAPAGVTASSISTSTSPGTTVKWQAVSGATSYRLFRAGNENIEGRKPGEQWGPATSGLQLSNHQLVTAGGWYCYRVAAVNSSGQGPFSDKACVSA